jgi:hypothetical protein
MVSDWDTGAAVPHFGLEDTGALADFLEGRFPRPAVEQMELLIGDRRMALDAQAAQILIRTIWSLVGDGRAAAPPVAIELRIPRSTT